MVDPISTGIGATGAVLAVTKLSEVVRAVGWTLYEPTHAVRMAKADARASQIKLDAEIEGRDRLARAKAREDFVGARRAENHDAILGRAKMLLPHVVCGAPVDRDWAAAWFEACQDVGNQYLQELWARILAGEIGRPGSVSRRTLQTLKNLSQAEAQEFQRFARKIWVADGECYVLLLDEPLRSPDLRATIGLANAGLVRPHQFITLSFKIDEELLRFFNRKVWVRSLSPLNPATVHVVNLTAEGSDLFDVLDVTPDDEYYASCVDFLSRHGFATRETAE